MKLKNILNESNRDAFNRSLTREQKREIMDSVSRFNEFGSKIYKTNEIAIVTNAYTHEARVQSYTLIANEFN